MTDTVFIYNESKNPRKASVIGVPLRDLTQRDIDGLTPHALASVEAADFYEKVVATSEPASPQPVSEAAEEKPKRRRSKATAAEDKE